MEKLAQAARESNRTEVILRSRNISDFVKTLVDKIQAVQSSCRVATYCSAFTPGGNYALGC